MEYNVLLNTAYNYKVIKMINYIFNSIYFGVLLVIISLAFFFFHDRLFELQKNATIPKGDRKIRAVLTAILFFIIGLSIIIRQL